METTKMVMLPPERCSFFEHSNFIHCITVEQGTSIEDVLKPHFLAHVAGKLRPYDEIRVRWDDGLYYAELLVTDVGRNWARARLKSEPMKLTTIDVAQTQFEHDAYEVVFKGPVRKWVVVRKADGAVIREQIPRQDEANKYLVDFMKQTA